MKWKEGAPTLSGIYWFHNGLNIASKNSVRMLPILLQVSKSSSHVFGGSSSMPLRSIYAPEICPRAVHMEISRPEKWTSFGDVYDKAKGNYNDYIVSWIKNKDGDFGVGLLKNRFHGFFCNSTIVWLKGGSIHGADINNTYKCFLIDVPRVEWIK